MSRGKWLTRMLSGPAARFIYVRYVWVSIISRRSVVSYPENHIEMLYSHIILDGDLV
jgi:hypothetical protein